MSRFNRPSSHRFNPTSTALILSTCVALISLCCAVDSVRADPLQDHPAIVVQRTGLPFDASQVMVMHPSMPTTHGTHANHEHPAVVISRAAAEHAQIDANRFIVQPPATTAWINTPDIERPTTLAAAR